MMRIPELFGDGYRNGDADVDGTGDGHHAGDGDSSYLQHYSLYVVPESGFGGPYGYWTSAEPRPLLELMESAGLIDGDIAGITRLAT